MALRPLLQTAVAAISYEAERFERSAARATRLQGAPSAAETAETVQISAEARRVSEARDSVLTAGIEGAMVDMRVAKYAFIASLKVLETGAELQEAAAKLLEK